MDSISMGEEVVYLRAISIKDLEKILPKNEIPIAIQWGIKKDWIAVYSYKGEPYIVLNPKYGGIWNEQGKPISKES